MMRPGAPLLMLALLVGTQASSQNPGASLPAFEVASINPSDPSGGRSTLLITPGGGLDGRNLTLKVLIERAYSLLDSQLSGGPAWIDSERFDIRAKAPATPRDESVPGDPAKLTVDQSKLFQDQFTARLQALLADRFQLKLHRETRDLPVYALVVAKRGLKIREAAGQGIRFELHKDELDAASMPIATLTRILAQRLGRPVLDQTGLTGAYTFKLQWTPHPPATPADSVVTLDSANPSLFTALEEQLGLKLESKRGPADVVVIERAERPSEN
ncbi:MAG TPA: TIGR03435 family protein [Bryobacteraceae bacterium]|nr:TIGR03435 family protein [Bryobacteraceae bacterium]